MSNVTPVSSGQFSDGNIRCFSNSALFRDLFQESCPHRCDLVPSVGTHLADWSCEFTATLCVAKVYFRNPKLHASKSESFTIRDSHQ